MIDTDFASAFGDLLPNQETVTVYRKTGSDGSGDTFDAGTTVTIARKRPVSEELLLSMNALLSDRYCDWTLWGFLGREGDVIQQGNGTRWSVVKTSDIIMDAASACVCKQEVP